MEELDFLTDYKALTVYGNVIVFEHNIEPLILGINPVNKYVSINVNDDGDMPRYLLSTHYRSIKELKLLIDIIYQNNFNHESHAH